MKHTYLIIFLILLSCSKSKSKSDNYITSDINSAEIVTIKSSEVSGSSLMVTPGSLPINMTVAISKGEEITSEEMKILSTEPSQIMSKSIMISNDNNMSELPPGSVPMNILIPLSVTASLTSFSLIEKHLALYIKSSGENSCYNYLILSNNFEVIDNMLSYKTLIFGSYQAVSLFSSPLGEEIDAGVFKIIKSSCQEKKVLASVSLKPKEDKLQQTLAKTAKENPENIFIEKILANENEDLKNDHSLNNTESAIFFDNTENYFEDNDLLNNIEDSSSNSTQNDSDENQINIESSDNQSSSLNENAMAHSSSNTSSSSIIDSTLMLIVSNLEVNEDQNYFYRWKQNNFSLAADRISAVFCLNQNCSSCDGYKEEHITKEIIYIKTPKVEIDTDYYLCSSILDSHQEIIFSKNNAKIKIKNK